VCEQAFGKALSKNREKAVDPLVLPRSCNLAEFAGASEVRVRWCGTGELVSASGPPNSEWLSRADAVQSHITGPWADGETPCRTPIKVLDQPFNLQSNRNIGEWGLGKNWNRWLAKEGTKV
jgi:hypothetical protein